MTDCREITACRVCGGQAFDTVIDLGHQALSGQFPPYGDTVVDVYPLELVRCASGCGLVQLRHTVAPGAMFSNYYYKSGVSLTMRGHLQDIADEALAALGRVPGNVLDIGGNDGTLVDHIAGLYGAPGTCVDPSDVAPNTTMCRRVKDFYPSKEVEGEKFDLIFSVACFYAQDDPKAFASAVHENLSDDGLWVIEVGYLREMMARLGYDSICHEHLCYYDGRVLGEVLRRCGFFVLAQSFNGMNGGSTRIIAQKAKNMTGGVLWEDPLPDGSFDDFADHVHVHRNNLRRLLEARVKERKTIHLLGASTKSNTVLQWCGITPELVALASDRDPRKRGRKTPGTNIPVVSEEESRALRPDIYLSFLGHFKDELIRREGEFLMRGGKLAFALPEIEEIGL